MDDVVARARRLLIKKIAAWGLWGGNIALIIYFWLPNGVPEVTTGDLPTMLHAVGRLFGLIATYCALVQFILMGRVGWLEPIFGMDKLALFHRLNGYATIIFILLHSGSMTLTHPILTGSANVLSILEVPYIVLAMVGEGLFVATVFLSVYIVRKHLKFETWYAVHLLNYAAIALVPWHQLTNGGDFLTNEFFANYWIGLYAFTALNVLLWRFGRTGVLYVRHRFVVDRVVPETPTATSVYIGGRSLGRFRAKGGQFVLVRFLDKRVMLQEHPFSLSRLPNSEGLRLTIRQLGDFTNLIPTLKPGTPVWVSGPFGSFTHDRRVAKKLLYIAGGIGITPIRSMIEEQHRNGEKIDSVLVYGNRTESDTIFLGELTQFGKKLSMPIHNVLSEQKDYKGEIGFVDKEKIARLVPDVAERDVFLCGPPPMMWAVVAQLKELGVPAGHIHYERFSLHKD